MGGWTPVVEAPAGWTPVGESAPPGPKESTYRKLTAAYNPDVEEWAQKHPIAGPIIRFLDATGGAAMSTPEMIVNGIKQAVHNPPNFKQAASELGTDKEGASPEANEAAKFWSGPNVREKVLSVLPEALGQGTGLVAGGEAIAAPFTGAAASEVTPASRLRAQLDHAHKVSGQPPLPLAIPKPGLFPSTARAGAALQDVKATAGDVPIDMSKPGATALELYTQSQRGATLPKVVRDLVNRTTKPDSTPLTYAEAKDFQSNISRLSANERMNLTPATSRLVGQLNQDLKSSLEGAADVAGKGEQFKKAMSEYHNAMRIQDWTDTVKKNAWKAALTGVVGYELKRLLGL